MTYRAITFHDTNTALGVACRLMIDQPAFAPLPFGSWIAAMAGQVERGHIRFFIDEANHVAGFFGSALTTPEDAEAWAYRNAILEDQRCREGSCMLFNVWAATNKEVSRAMLTEARRVSAGKAAVYFKRFYRNGRIRPTHLALAGTNVGRKNNAL